MKLLRSFPAADKPADGLRISPDGQRAAAIGFCWDVEPMSRVVHSWDLAAGTSSVSSFSLDQYPLVQLLPELASVVVTRAEGEPLPAVIELRTGAVTRTLPWPEGPGALSPTGAQSVQSVVGGVALVDLEGRRWLQSDRAYARWVAVGWATPELVLVASHHPKKTLSVHDARDGSLLARHPTVEIAEGFVIAPGGLRILTQTSTNKPAVLIEVATGEALKRPLLKKGLVSFAFSPDGAVLAAASEDGRVVLLGDDASEPVGEFASGFASPRLAWTPDGRALVVVDGETGAMGLWDTSSLPIAPAPPRTLAEVLLRSAAPEAAPLVAPRVEVVQRGPLEITLVRPPPELESHRAAIEGVLGKALPEEVASFYARADGVRFSVTKDGASLGLDETLLGLADLFGGFAPHRQFRTASAYEKAADEGTLGELPFWGDTWSEDFELGERGALKHLNALMRSKPLVRLTGRSDALVIDFAPAAQKGAAYQLGLAHRGHEFHALDLTFSALVEHFERFGGASWYLAYLTVPSIRAMNIDPVPTVELDLAAFADGVGEEVDAIVARARGLAKAAGV